MEQQSNIGPRVREAISRHYSTVPTDASIAAEIGMTPDAFSRSVRGSRHFSSLEIARLADLLNEDVHWLITGETDPYRVVFAARHEWDAQAMRRHVPGREADAEALEAIRLAYTQALIWLDGPQPVSRKAKEGQIDPWTGQEKPAPLPASPADVRALLGPDFVRNFADRAEERLGIDVVRVAGLSTAYSFTIGDHRVVVLNAQGNWFRSNFNLAHEIGHLALGHHEATTRSEADERAADQFASELLLPAADMRAVNWETIDEEHIARFLWESGVSTHAVSVRLNMLSLPVARQVREALNEKTQTLLRRHPSVTSAPVVIQPGMSAVGLVFATADPITARMQHSAERRIPTQLLTHHLDGIAAGRINKGTLAWLLNTPVEELDVDEPAPAPEMSADELMAELGLAPSE